ncbi:hypothetical protein [Bacillus chungangensis]|uniref:Sporulation histidine kinase inhibitor Sda n=1 Tax=Bacillus chungangensis TaxID=587633 RepID=A0ABT9WZK1_9BACI|nr:hypothetical protein [Bacillus chungangensis]MDQ0178292.1 hypothetical protein [Bacillus chungangensis]
MKRKVVNNTLDVELYKKIKVLAVELDENANELIEESIELVLKKYGKAL